ncbi:MAG TPA: hypothetical protein VFK50_06395 [Sphingomicrobium sp.]|nr:hypothetical protein [Sphingomicrobium sp.]
MVDEIYDRNYQDGRAALNDGLDRLFGLIGRELGKSLKAVHRFEWSAPWARTNPVRPGKCA